MNQSEQGTRQDEAEEETELRGEIAEHDMPEQELFHNRSEQDDHDLQEWDDLDRLDDLIRILRFRDILDPACHPGIDQVDADQERIQEYDPDSDPFQRIHRIGLTSLCLPLLPIGAQAVVGDDDSDREADRKPPTGDVSNDVFRKEILERTRNQLDDQIDDDWDDVTLLPLLRHHERQTDWIFHRTGHNSFVMKVLSRL